MFSRYCRLLCRKYCKEANLPNKKQKELKKRFLDQLRIYARGGAGGQGIAKYGGVGGKGGDVILACTEGVTLKRILDKYPERRFIAKTGKNSGKHYLLGENGENLVIAVPPGVTVRNDEGRELADLNKDGQEYIVATGGAGGHPGNSFLGRKGEARTVTLVLKLIADIGLVGFPNAGKSTFLGAISRTSPKIASYPFTTLKPQIGTMEFQDHRQITVADLPGLIEGAHVNFGLGHKFLKHIERTKILLFMVDIFGFQLKQEFSYRTAFETILLLNRELELYKKELLDKPAVLALNKVDMDPDGTALQEVMEKIKKLPDSLSEIPEEMRPERLVKFDEIFVISAQNKQGTEDMKLKLRALLDSYGEQQNQKQLTLKIKETETRIEKSKEYSNVKLI